MVNKIICPSTNLEALVRSYCFVDESRTSVIQNGIDTESFSSVKNENQDAYLGKYGLKDGNYILFVGRLTILKGIQYAVEAFRRISKQNPDIKMAIVGRGEFEVSLRNLAKDMKNVVFVGYVVSSRMRKALYNGCLLLVVPSLYEALPMVVLEAMACGKPIVASNVGGIPTLVRDGKNGFLARPGDPEDLERLMSILCKDEKLRGAMGSFGRTLVENEFSSKHMVDQTLKIYESLCSSA